MANGTKKWKKEMLKLKKTTFMYITFLYEHRGTWNEKSFHFFYLKHKSSGGSNHVTIKAEVTCNFINYSFTKNSQNFHLKHKYFPTEIYQILSGSVPSLNFFFSLLLSSKLHQVESGRLLLIYWIYCDTTIFHSVPSSNLNFLDKQEKNLKNGKFC